MNNKKTVFLFGAGAALSWGAPKTSELTDLIRTSGFKTSDNETYITEFIYQTLLVNGFAEKDINFETIINVIEELLSYYSQFDPIKKIPPILKGFLTPVFDDAIFNYSIKGGEPKHNYQLEIPKGKEYHFSRFAQHDETPHQFFLQHVITDLLTYINARISFYAYHTTGNSVIDTDSNASKLFVNWIRNFTQKGTIRIYTLNYDRIFKVLLERAGLTVFEGFDCGEYVDYSASLRANVPKILMDNENHVHYNLHGSAFWRMKALDSSLLPNPEFFLTSAPVLPVNDDHVAVQVEKGRNILPANIITGYQKAQKTLITPLKQMQSAFDRDCCFADEIYIIGYSLGDEHINESIKTAIRYNPTVRITIVDPFFLLNDLDFQMAIKLFPYRQSGIMQPVTITPHKLHSFFDGAFILHTVDFETFLQEQSVHQFIL